MPHDLIRTGKATLVRNAADVLELIGMGDTAPPRVPSAIDAIPPNLASHEAALYRALRGRPLPLDQLAASASLTASELSIALIALELRGLARRSPGGLAQRTSGVRVAREARAER
jgi:predicted Rossmann fold nucleotide-binding protein DprA/Smf involved in DNA uptake